MSASPRWRWFSWKELDTETLYALLQLRSAVFVVEQNCVFADMDGLDRDCQHLCAWTGTELVAYLRLVPPGVKTREPGLGRLVVAARARRQGLARQAVVMGLERARARYPGEPVYGQAQAHLVPFYESLGFRATGPEYDEDGIPHVDMRFDGGVWPKA